LSSEKKEMSRRNFLGMGATAIVGIAVGGAAGYFAGMQAVPPGVTSTATITAPGLMGRKLKLAVVTPSRANDFSWGQQGVDGLRIVARKYNAEFSFSEGLGYALISSLNMAEGIGNSRRT